MNDSLLSHSCHGITRVKQGPNKRLDHGSRERRLECPENVVICSPLMRGSGIAAPPGVSEIVASRHGSCIRHVGCWLRLRTARLPKQDSLAGARQVGHCHAALLQEKTFLPLQGPKAGTEPAARQRGSASGTQSHKTC